MIIRQSAASSRTTLLSFAFVLAAGFFFGANDAAAQSIKNAPPPEDTRIDDRVMKNSELLMEKEADMKKLLQEGRDALEAKDYETAEAKFQAILDENPYQPQVNYYMAVVKIGEGDVPSSVPFLDTAIAANPEYVEPRFLLAKIALMTGNTEVAQAQLDALKEIQAACQSGGCEANTDLLPAAVSELEGALS